MRKLQHILSEYSSMGSVLNKGLWSQFAPSVRHRRFVTSGLHRNSEDRSRHSALASQSDASGHSDKVPVLAQHAGQGALTTPSVLPEHGLLAQNLATQLERYRAGKPSLFSSGEVPKPTVTYSFCWLKKWKFRKEAALPPRAFDRGIRAAVS